MWRVRGGTESGKRKGGTERRTKRRVARFAVATAAKASQRERERDSAPEQEEKRERPTTGRQWGAGGTKLQRCHASSARARAHTPDRELQIWLTAPRRLRLGTPSHDVLLEDLFCVYLITTFVARFQSKRFLWFERREKGKTNSFVIFVSLSFFGPRGLDTLEKWKGKETEREALA